MTLPLSQATLEEYNASTHNANKSLLTNYNPLLPGMASDWQEEVWDSILSATTYTRAIVKGRWMDSLLGIRVGGELISFNATLHWFWILMVSFGVWECRKVLCTVRTTDHLDTMMEATNVWVHRLSSGVEGGSWGQNRSAYVKGYKLSNSTKAKG